MEKEAPQTRQPLPFLEAVAVELNDPDRLRDRIHRSLPLRAFLETNREPHFFHRSGVVQVGDLPVSCSLHSPMEVAFDDSAFATLALPCAGTARVGIDGQRLTLEGGPMAAYLPGAAFTASTETFGEVMICLDRRRLAETAAALGGFDRRAGSYGPRFQRPLLVDGSRRTEQAELLAHLQLALQMAEAPLLRSVGGLRAAILEDLLYRLVAALVCPELVAGAAGTVPFPSRDRIFDELLEWIQAHLHTPITTTDLSRRSSYSPRSLQYLFHRKFGCSPMQWVKRQRLNAVHRDLQRAQPGETVAEIARRHGFGHLSSFAASFQRSYGMAPSTLLRHSRMGTG